MSLQLYSHSKGDLEKAVEIILKKATEFTLPAKPVKLKTSLNRDLSDEKF